MVPNYRLRQVVPNYKLRQVVPHYRLRQVVPNYRLRQVVPNYRLRQGDKIMLWMNVFDVVGVLYVMGVMDVIYGMDGWLG